MKRVGIFGISCVDIIANGAKAFPKPGALDFVDNISMHTGGCALNSAIDYKKLGFDPCLVTFIGNDSFGDYINNTVKEQGIDPKYIVRLTDKNTSASVVLVKPDGERGFLHNPGVNKTVCLKDINLDFLDQIDILFVAGTLVMNNLEENGLDVLLKTAKEKGIYTVLDTVYDASGRWSKVIMPLLKYLDLFAPSFDEAKAIAKTDDIKEMIKVFRNAGAKNIIIKTGKDGAVSYFDNTFLVHKPYKVAAKDTTGAGDAFMSGILVGLAKGWNINETIDFANAVGAHAVMATGASTGIKAMDQIIDFMKKGDMR